MEVLQNNRKSARWGLHSMDELMVAKDSWWWKKAMKSLQAAKAKSPVSMLISQLTGAPSRDSQRCVKPWTAESQVKQGVRR